MFSKAQNQYRFILILIIAVGGFLRLYNLGTLPITGDNSYMALAVKGIFETGWPSMPNGNLYLRSIPLLYLETLSCKIFGYSEWGLRFPNAIIGTFNIFLVYKLTSTILSKKKAALFTALLFALSPWAVAVSRMSRMYETLLMAVLLSWILFYNWYYFKKKNLTLPLILASVLTIILHQLAVLPLACFIAPLLLERELSRKTILPGCYYISFLIFWYIYYHNIPSLLYYFYK